LLHFQRSFVKQKMKHPDRKDILLSLYEAAVAAMPPGHHPQAGRPGWHDGYTRHDSPGDQQGAQSGRISCKKQFHHLP
jgi:hypothetical protein